MADQPQQKLNYSYLYFESGQYLQRIDHLGLVFKDAQGNELQAGDECRLEISAWADRVTFFLDFSAETASPITQTTIRLVSPGGITHLSTESGNQSRLTLKPHDDSELPPLDVGRITAATNLQDGLPLTVSHDEDVHALKIAVPANPVSYSSAANRVDEYLIEVTNPSGSPENIPLVFDQPTPRAITGTVMVLYHRRFYDYKYEFLQDVVTPSRLVFHQMAADFYLSPTFTDYRLVMRLSASYQMPNPFTSPGPKNTMRPLVVNLHPEFAHTTHNDKALARNGSCYWISWFEKSKTDPAAAGTVRRHNPPLPRPPVRLNGSFMGLPQKANSSQSAKLLAAIKPFEKTFRQVCAPLMEGRTACVPPFLYQHVLAIKRALQWLVLSIVMIGFAAPAGAEVLIQQTGQNEIFAVADTDLLQTSVSSAIDNLILNAGENGAAGGETPAVLINGVFGAADRTQSVVIASGSITYNLDTSVNVFGYDITNINTYAGWVDYNRGSQSYTVSYSRIGDADFTDLATVTLNHDGFTQEKYSIMRNDNGILASRVDSIRFTFPLQEFSGVGYKEIDVFGSPNSGQVEDVSDTIFAVTTPMRGAIDLTLPTVPPGFELTIKSSSLPGVVATDGTINPPPTNTVVQLVLTLRNIQNNQTADTQTIHLFVPAASIQPPFVSYAKNFTMRRGLFIHWSAPPDGLGNPIAFSDGSRSVTIDEFTASFDVPAVVSQIVSLGFEYAILTDFHGYQTTLHPCAALDSWRIAGCTSSRDLIGEMIAALKAQGIPVYLFTHPLDGQNGYSSEDQERIGWFDCTGNYRRFNDYVNDVYAELTERYGDDIAGFGFDSEFGMIQANYLGKLDLKRLRETILSRRPHLSLHGLAGPNDTVELGLKEVWRPDWLDPWGWRSDTDYDVENWPAYRRYVGIVQGYHWTTITPPSGGMARLNGAQMFRYSVLQAGVATEGPGVAWAATPYTDGTWENGVGEAFTVLQTLTQPLRESLRDVLPSTSYPRDEGVWLSTLPQGVVATRKPDDTVEYIHVLNPPAGNTLTLPLPADGKRFVSASLLSNGHAVQLVTNSDAVSLTLDTGDTWDIHDSVIKLLVEPDSVPPLNLALHKPVDASSSVQFGSGWGTTTPWGYIRLVDGQTSAITATNGWSAGNYGYSSVPSASNGHEWVSVDLETVRWVNTVRMYPRNDGVNLGYGYPVDFEISTSLDGVNWLSAVSVTDQALPVAMETHSFSTRAARYVRIDASQLRANPNDYGNYSLQLAELDVLGFNSLPVLMWNTSQNSMVLEWDYGVLQSTDNLKDIFTDVPAAKSPYTVDPSTAPQQFYRLRY